jgi:hypothetical protein
LHYIRQRRILNLGAVYTRVFCVRFSVRDGAAAHQFPLLFSRDHVREKQRKLVGSVAITDGETDAKNASVYGPLEVDIGALGALKREQNDHRAI